MLSGEGVSRGNGLANSEIYAIWLKFPECDTPFLELHQHKVTHDRPRPRVNEPGFAHLSFQVDDIGSTLSTLIEAGGGVVGEITDFGSKTAPFLIAYACDPEGNILELEQPTGRM